MAITSPLLARARTFQDLETLIGVPTISLQTANPAERDGPSAKTRWYVSSCGSSESTYRNNSTRPGSAAVARTLSTIARACLARPLVGHNSEIRRLRAHTGRPLNENARRERIVLQR